MIFTCDDPVHRTLVSEIKRLQEANQAQTNVSRALQTEIEELRDRLAVLESHHCCEGN